MSESVKIGGIGKNPAIDRINSLNAVDIKNQAVKKMEQLLLKPDVSQTGRYTGTVPVDFDKVNWKAGSRGSVKSEKEIQKVNQRGNDDGRMYMEGIKMFSGKDLYHAPTRVGKTIERNTGGEISIQYETAGSIRGLAGRPDTHVKHAGQAAAGKTGLSGSTGDTARHQPYLPGER